MARPLLLQRLVVRLVWLMLPLLSACAPLALPAEGTSPASPPSPKPTEQATAIAIPTPAEATPAFPLDTPTEALRYTCPLAGSHLPRHTCRVVNVYPHDPTAYTQGLIFRHGLLYESTGLRGKSSLRRVRLESGEVLQQLALSNPYFGEGLTELNGRLFQLTWQEEVGFIYDLQTFERVGEFSYRGEGWGLTSDGRYLIMSDGSDLLRFLDPHSLQVIDERRVSDDRGSVTRLNELEYIEGEIWANIYQTACLARIDPQSGQVLAWVDLSGLHDPRDHPGAEVPNGIAYDPLERRLFVSGKFWDRLYEIECLPPSP